MRNKILRKTKSGLFRRAALPRCERLISILLILALLVSSACGGERREFSLFRNDVLERGQAVSATCRMITAESDEGILTVKADVQTTDLRIRFTQNDASVRVSIQETGVRRENPWYYVDRTTSMEGDLVTSAFFSVNGRTAEIGEITFRRFGDEEALTSGPLFEAKAAEIGALTLELLRSLEALLEPFGTNWDSLVG